MIRRLCDYQNRLQKHEFIVVACCNGDRHFLIYKDDVLVPCSGFIEINRPETSPNPYPCMINTASIDWVKISKEIRL